jgi:hypothetical protein
MEKLKNLKHLASPKHDTNLDVEYPCRDDLD